MQQLKYWLWLLILLCSAACTSQSAKSTTPLPTPADDEAIARFLTSAPSRQRGVVLASTPQTLINEDQSLPLPAIEPLEVTGDFVVAGSPAVAMVTRAAYAQFIRDGFGGVIKIQEIGTTPAFELYCKTGESDLAMALRPILPAELDACLQHGRTPVALPIGINPIAIIVNPANQFANNVTLAELAQVFTAVRWSDVNPDWPAENIVRFVPDPTFGSFSYFVDQVLDGDDQRLRRALSTTLKGDQSTIALSVAEKPYAVGFVDYPFYAANAKNLKLLTVNGVKPDAATVNDGSYALRNLLLLYTDPATLQAKPQVGAFLTFYLTQLPEVINEGQEFSGTTAMLDRSKLLLLHAMGDEAYITQLYQKLKQTPTVTPSPMLTATITPTLISATNTPSN